MAEIKIAIDLGTTKTNIYMLGSGIVLSEPSVVAYQKDNRQVKAVGLDAKKLIDKTTDNTAICMPIFEGIVSDEEFAEEMLYSFLKKIECVGAFKRVHALFAIPLGLEDEEVLKIERVARRAGIKKIDFVLSPVCSALSIDRPLNDFSPCFMVDMGGGVTNIAAVLLDGVIQGIGYCIGGGNIDSSIMNYVQEKHGLLIGRNTAENIKIKIGSLYRKDTSKILVRGRSVDKGIPSSLELTAVEIFDILKVYYDNIIKVIENVLSKLPPEVSADIFSNGIYLCGGSSQIAGLCEYFEENLSLRANVLSDSTFSVVMGAGIILGNNELLQRLKMNY